MHKIKDWIKKRVKEETFLWKILVQLNRVLYFLQPREKRVKKKISNYLKNLKPRQELKVIFGSHWFDTQEWLVFNEEEQNIKKPLIFSNESVDVIYTEHVIEHVQFLDAVAFIQESKRILKSGGVFRVVCPMVERIMSAGFSDKNGKIFVHNFIETWSDEDKLMNELGLNGIFESPETFFLNGIFTKYGHKFIWSAELMVKVLKVIGFREAAIKKIGEGINQEYCIERRMRGLYLGHNWNEDRSTNMIYDPESLVVEAIK
jgi:predicted SAM-dependent methyltransferase